MRVVRVKFCFIIVRVCLKSETVVYITSMWLAGVHNSPVGVQVQGHVHDAV